MRVAVAGTNGLARWIAYYLSKDGNHQFILLSRAPKPSLANQGWQIIVVDYSNESNLIYSLAGVDVVISLVSGSPQLSLIDAALHAGVERFIPAEFEGSPLRMSADGPLGRGRGKALDRLRQYESQGMAHTAVACGILYERFAPGGMIASDIGGSCGPSAEGDYLLDIRSMRSQVPHNESGSPAVICMTAAQDVGQFVVAALKLPQLPTELRVYGSRMSVSEVVRIAELMKEGPFERAEHSPDTLHSALMFAQSSHDEQQIIRVQMLIATGEGRFDFDEPNLNAMVDIVPMPFAEWLRANWAGQVF